MSDKLHHLDEQNFKSNVSKGLVLVDFYADWCGPCKMMSPIIDKLAGEMSDQVSFAKLDIEKAQGITAQFQVTSIPTLILFKDGQEVARAIGLKDGNAIKKLIAPHL